MADEQGADLFRTSVSIAAPPEHVFRYWVEPDLLASWLGISAQVEAHPGGEFRFEVAPGEWCVGTYVELDPPHRLVVTWGWASGRIDLPPGSTRVEVDFKEVDGGTQLDLVHSGLAGDALRLHADGWPRFLGRLVAVVAGRDPGPPLGTESPERALERLGQP